MGRPQPPPGDTIAVQSTVRSSVGTRGATRHHPQMWAAALTIWGLPTGLLRTDQAPKPALNAVLEASRAIK